MKRFVFLGLVLAVVVAGRTSLAAEGSDQQVSPPPVNSANIYKEVFDTSGEGMYLSFADITGFGLILTQGYGLTDRFGIAGSVGSIAMSGDIETAEYSSVVVPLSATAQWEALGGNTMSPVGEVQERKATLSLFAGPQATFMAYTIDMEVGYGRYRRSTSTSDSDVMLSLQGGGVVDVPLGTMLSLVPYAYIGVGDVETTSYGADILLRPFRNAQHWEISLGTAMQQVKANDEDSTIVMLGVTNTRGKHWGRTQGGPVLK